MEGVRRDLRMVVPPFLHNLMSGTSLDHFVAKIEHGMQQQRANGAERVREVLPKLFDNALDRNMLLGFNVQTRKYDLLPPVFFPKWDINNKWVFTSDILVNVALCLLRGPSAIRAKKEGKAVNSNTVVKYWGLKSVTPGFIALVAILTRFGLSGDPEFTPIGASGITYAEDFTAYKFMLYKLYNKPSIRGVFQTYNSVIFPDRPADEDPIAIHNEEHYKDMIDRIDNELDSDST
ncbi:hypothetical protein BDQ17DRAFT_394208 [Cyathus striatus]|nr:hypothetical protein BDQ17DRAFT_394208 [Cyathus striatus]